MNARKSFRVKTDLTCSLVTDRVEEIVRLINLSVGGAALEVDRCYSVGQLMSAESRTKCNTVNVSTLI
jgi:hypothetical protein